MSRETWAIVKNNRNFYVHIYRNGLFLLLMSLGLCCVLSVILFYMYYIQPERDYYASNGITPPVQLQSMLAPNSSSQALLEPDPPTDDAVRVIPQ
jgi:intracellular multiplication protein IcmM